MKCAEAIKKWLCLGCGLAEQNINADNRKYREQSGLDLCKKILEGEQKGKMISDDILNGILEDGQITFDAIV